MHNPIALLVVVLNATAQVSGAGVPAANTPGLMLLSLPNATSLPLLELSRGATTDGPDAALTVRYLGALDENSLTRDRSAHIAAERVFDAFRAWSVTNAVYEVTISALGGTPGAPGQMLSMTWRRTGSNAWSKGAPVFRTLEIPRLPNTIRNPGTRDEKLEARTKTAALAFVRMLDAKEFARAWDNSSAAMRGTTAPADLEYAAQLSLNLAGRVRERHLAFWMYPATPAHAAAEGALALLRFVAVTDAGEGVEDITLTLEVEDAWRVAGYRPSMPVPRHQSLPHGAGK